ncbi:MAG: P-II family nitrogen regulator [Chloroflexota bacterium]
MYLIMFVLDDPDKLEEILEAWSEAGVNGVTVLPSTGLGRINKGAGYRDDLPLIPGLGDFYNRAEEYHRTLFTVVKGDKTVKKVVEATEAIIGDLDLPNTGMLVVLPVSQAYGLERKSPEK